MCDLLSDLVTVAERMATIKHKIRVLSGKGGVGKSTFSAQLSFALAEMDSQVGLLHYRHCWHWRRLALGMSAQNSSSDPMLRLLMWSVDLCDSVALPMPEIAADPTLITTDTPVAHPREKQLLPVLRRISCRSQHRLQAQALGSEPEGEGFTLRPREKRPREKHHRPL
ncbi:hypothetical protein B296_00052032 [Ensete ventricosum]|uniref:Uncharacterized protein n=1 Tax=Ensete ventricosum TaxID=4639 RepID=A0A426YE14_ENSVE|nr:hypothetical protein B296_00052032 [Ensete ventricosum]